MGIAPFTTNHYRPKGQTAPSPQPDQKRNPRFGEVYSSPDSTMVPVTEMLLDPIRRQEYKIPTPFDDKLLRLTATEKLKLDVKNAFVGLPNTIYQGLRGDGHFTFSDYLSVTSIPYYVGGAVLAASAAAGRDKLNMSRQGVGVLLYYLGVALANKSINAFYKHKTGVDLDLRYKKANGDIEKLYASTDFPRFDLLEKPDYQLMMRKMHIPDNVADPKREVNDEARTIISASRADKLILGNLLAAFAAGYIARSDAWGRLPDGLKSIRQIWSLKNKDAGGILARTARTGSAISGTVGPALKEVLHGYPGENPLWRRGLLGSIGVVTGLIFLHSWQAATRNRSRVYESPFISNLSPALSPEQSLYTAAVQRNLPGGMVNKLPRKGVFDVVQHIESGGPMSVSEGMM